MLVRMVSLSYFVWFVAASPTNRNLVVHESRETAPLGFSLKGPALGSTSLTLRIALISQNLAGLESVLYDVSAPSSASYGEFLTKEEVEAYVAPTKDAVAAVNSWLSGEDLTSTSISPSGNWLSIDTTVDKANALLGTTFSTYTHDATGKEAMRALSYSVPAAVQQYIELIHPTIAFPVYNPKLPISSKPAPKRIQVPPTKTEKRDVPSSCETEIEPTCLQALYSIPTTPATQSNNGIAVAGYDDEYPQTYDLELFLYNFRTDMDYTTTYVLQEIDGGADPQNATEAGLESNLDVQYTVGVATDVPIYFVSVGEDNEDGVDGFLDIINFILGESSPPWVMSTSYAFNEPDIPFTLANNLCNAYMQLGVRGVSSFFGSGDGGVSGVQSQSCTDFIPTFPSTCPYVTSVGATGGINPEVSASFSGGGFSNYFGVPEYQSSVVSSYLSGIGSTNSGLFNASGRAVPDVAAQGENVIIVSGGDGYLVAGTSCSTPIFASVVALLNEQLLAAGKSTLGFVNPLLYENPSAFFDITSGDNPGCNTNGFSAATGWDPVTGLGTPNFPSLLNVVGA